MYAVCRSFGIGLVTIPLLWGCNDARIDRHPDSYVVVKYIADGDKYVIRHGNSEIEAACKTSSFITKNDRRFHATKCLTSMPVGKELKVTKHGGDWLYAEWNDGNIDWQMHLRVVKEELKQGTPASPIHASVWPITIATFLGTVVAVLLMVFIFSRRKQIGAALREQRIERRIPAQVGLELSRLDEPLIYEKALTENASHHGARVVAKKPWQPNDHVLVRLPGWDSPSRARIAYCNALPRNAFVIGLQFPLMVDWLTASSDMSNDELSSNPYRK